MINHHQFLKIKLKLHKKVKMFQKNLTIFYKCGNIRMGKKRRKDNVD